MSFRMWVEFQEALGTLFGASWAIIISMMVYLLYQSHQNELKYNAAFGVFSPSQAMQKAAHEKEHEPPALFIAGLYLFIIFIFNILLDTIG